MEGHLSCYEQENNNMIKFILFFITNQFLKNCNKFKYLYYQPHIHGLI
jgi:hypothetical protein